MTEPATRLNLSRLALALLLAVSLLIGTAAAQDPEPV